jgi:hypothetical protein
MDQIFIRNKTNLGLASEFIYSVTSDFIMLLSWLSAGFVQRPKASGRNSTQLISEPSRVVAADVDEPGTN